MMVALDPAEVTLQVPTDTGRNVVFRSVGEDRSWCDGTAKR